jgi:hypothetical protein
VGDARRYVRASGRGVAISSALGLCPVRNMPGITAMRTCSVSASTGDRRAVGWAEYRPGLGARAASRAT